MDGKESYKLPQNADWKWRINTRRFRWL